MQLKFKSFYKIKNASYKDSINKNSELVSIFFYFFYLKITNFKIKNNPTHSLNALKESFKTTFFVLPVRKKSIIFLRAPYKNKLARLNILRLQFTSVLSIKFIKTFSAAPKFLPIRSFNKNFVNSLIIFSKYNLSTYKKKHSKTVIFLEFSMRPNFLFSTFI